MKRNLIAFLGKPKLKIIDLQNHSKDFSTYFINHEVQDDFVLCLANETNIPSWAPLFSGYNIEDHRLLQKSTKGALYVKVEDQYIIFTFGYGRSLINKSSVERGFGLRVAMNLGNPDQLKSIDKSTLERVARNTRSQVVSNSGIQDFDFEFDHEILKSITAIISREDDELEMISGNDSVALYTEIEFEKFHEIAERLLDAYHSITYKEKYPWAEFIGIESDPEIIKELEETLVDRFNNRDTSEFWIAPPKIIDYDDFSGFLYSPKTVKQGAPCKHIQMNLDAFLEEAPFKNNHAVSVNSIKNKEIQILNGSDQIIDTINFFEALNGEIELNSQKYILNDGHWYHIKDSFAKDIEDYFNNLPRWDGLESKPYNDKRECCYLRRIADGEEIAVLDQHWVRQNDTNQNYEFCDLITQDDRIVHVKKYGGSSVLSHLFAQATNGINMLLNSPEIIPQIEDHLSDTYISFIFNPSEPRRHKIVFAIIQEREGILHLPFFSKVNLRHHAREMQNKGFIVELAKIPVDMENLPNTLNNSELSCKCHTKGLSANNTPTS